MSKFQEFINAEFLKYMNQRGRVVSASEFARWLEVSEDNLSKWMNGSRAPTGANTHRLALKLGPAVYDILGEPRRLPDDPELQQLVKSWYDADDIARRKVLEILEEERNKRNKTGMILTEA